MKNLSDIAVFVRVVDDGSFTTAAEALGLSKSVISKYVTRLETRLGARLLQRTTRRLSLTEVGQNFYQRAVKALAEIEDAELDVSRMQGEPRGTLRINTPMSFGILHIAPLLPEFMARYTQVEVDMNLEDRQVNLVEEGFDLAIRVAQLPDSSLVARRLGPCRHVVCAAPDYFNRHGVPGHPDDLQTHDCLTYRYRRARFQWHFLGPDDSEHNVAVSGRLHANNSLALREALLRGCGLTLAPTFLVGRDLKAGRLQAVLTRYRTLALSVYAIYPEKKHLSPKVRAFVDFMAEHISDSPPWDDF